MTAGGDAATATPTGASRQAIEHHYDVGGDFYDLWLDRRRVYSCALWDGEVDDDLEGAQAAKLDWHADALGAVDGGRVLDVGCGWGAMLHHLVSERGVTRATGLTLSADQASFAAGPPSIDVRLEDWRQHSPTGPYDGIVSIGALEHFTRPELSRPQRQAVYREFFGRCAAWLVDGGRLSLQTIAYEDHGAEPYTDTAGSSNTVPPGTDNASRNERGDTSRDGTGDTSRPRSADTSRDGRHDTGAVSSFFVEEIFPESELPRLSDLVVAAEPAFRVVALRSDAGQYEHTLHLWQRRLEANRDAATALVGRDTYRRYLRYLRVSRAMFDRGVCTLYRLVLQRRPSVNPGAPPALRAPPSSSSPPAR